MPATVGLWVGATDPAPGQRSAAEPIATASATEFVESMIASLSAAVALIGAQTVGSNDVAIVVITHTDFLAGTGATEGRGVAVGDKVGGLVGKLAFCASVGAAENKVLTKLKVGAVVGSNVGMLLGRPVG